MSIHEYLPSPLFVLLAGTFGAVLLIVFRPPHNLRVGIGQVSLGALAAMFIVPAVVGYFMHSSDVNMQSAVAFLIGMLGPVVAEIVIRALDRRGDAIADRLVTRVTGDEK